MIRVFALAAGVAAGGCVDAPAALDAFQPVAPPAGTVLVGVTADGVGRARLTLDDQQGFGLGNGIIGVRVRVSNDGGLTFFETLPREKVAMGRTIVVDALVPGASLDFAWTAVTNLGVESPTGVLAHLDVPAAQADVVVPPAITALAVFPGQGGVALRWPEPAADVFRTEVQRVCAGGALETIGVVDGSATPGFFDDSASGPCAWTVITEDLSGNRSAVSNEVTMEVL